MNIYKDKIKCITSDTTWPTPKLFGVGHFSEFSLYKITLSIAKSNNSLTIGILRKELPQRIKGLILVESISKTAYGDLIRELLHYSFIEKATGDIYKITDDGLQYLELCNVNPEEANDLLLEKMQEIFITPAWFINRLWEINPKGQGQIIIPSPIKDWKPKSKIWSDCAWDDSLFNVCKKTYDKISNTLPGSFPVEFDEWVTDLKKEYERIGHQRPRQSSDDNYKNKIHYSQRNRLSLVMKNISVKVLFSRFNPITHNPDFNNKRNDMTHRSFMDWCLRLEAFNLMVYTDYNKEIPGRLVFPIAAFKNENQYYKNYIKKDFVRNQKGEPLYLFSPGWEFIKKMYIETLVEVYQNFYNREGIIYISLQDIRDEVCRLLRISPALFERFLQYIYEESVKRQINYSISLETDLRLDMKVHINRRGVFLNGIMYSLIAIKPL